MKTKPRDLVDEVRRVLERCKFKNRLTEPFLTSYQILEELPEPLRRKLVLERRRAGKHCGIMTTSEPNISERVTQGFQVIGLGFDCGLLLRALHGAMAAARCDRAMTPSLTPQQAATPKELRAAGPARVRSSRRQKP